MLATGMDYLSRSARISRMDRIRIETMGIEMGMKKDILQETEEQLHTKMARLRHSNGGLQNC
jgi:hypothetical protein